MQRTTWVLLAAFAVSLPVLHAQVSSGTILGTVTDASGGSIVGVTVTVTDVATNWQRRVLTGSDGTYVAPNLRPGEYRITASASGFRPQTIQNIVLQVDQHARIDIMLQVGEVTQEITVVGSAPVIASDSATIGEVVDNRKVLELPLNGRQYLQLALLVPGVQRVSPTPPFMTNRAAASARTAPIRDRTPP